jgi:hypothetical protein
MSQTGYLILAICLIIVLVAIFIVSFILYKKTPPPKGCENVTPSEINCAGCSQAGCAFYAEYHKDEKKGEELKK